MKRGKGVREGTGPEGEERERLLSSSFMSFFPFFLPPLSPSSLKPSPFSDLKTPLLEEGWGAVRGLEGGGHPTGKKDFLP